MHDNFLFEKKEILKGLESKRAHLSPKYFYDQQGSILFESITKLKEYYPTRTEEKILADYSKDIYNTVGECKTIIEPGAGNCSKALKLCRILKPKNFIGVDISAEFLQAGVTNLKSALPFIEARAISGDITKRITIPPEVPDENRLFFYPGSSIGNFDPNNAKKLLTKMKSHLKINGSLLIGVDLIKSKAVLEEAYNDESGITAQFNLNILTNVNNVIRSDFNISDWRHYAFFNTQKSRIEMHLVSKKETKVSWPGGSRIFKIGETIHTENSYKYSPEVFVKMLQNAGFKSQTMWSDQNSWYLIVLAQVGDKITMPRAI